MSSHPRLVPIPGGPLPTRVPGGVGPTVEIASFLLGSTPVTNDEYAALVGSGRVEAPPWWSSPDFCAPRQPVVGATWEDAMEYCAWLAEATSGRWRLPTEGEWEFAACGGLVAPRTPWGEAIPSGEIPEGPLTGPWEVGRGTPNHYGLYDIGTIVHEWCLNWHEPQPQEAMTPLAGPGRRASRGGSWRHGIRWSSPSARSSLPPAYRYSDYGFRVLRELESAYSAA